jgi:diguanylate cyclase (GGDEF)-like protein
VHRKIGDACSVAFVLAIVPAAFAVIVLTGWATDGELLKRLALPATVTMNPTTAACFIALSLALLLRRAGSRRMRLAAAGLLVLVAAVGALKLLDVAAGTQLDVDTYLFASRLATGYARPSRIAPNAALCFVLISLALLALPRRSEASAIGAQLLALATGLVSIFAVVGYLYGVGAFYVVSVFFPMAIHTAFAFLCLTGVVFLHSAQRGLIRPISDPGPAGRTSRMLLPAAIIIPVGLGWLRQWGDGEGFTTQDIGIALMVMANVLTLTVLIWLNARLLLAADTRRRQAEADLERLATQDFLTGLANRGHFMDRLLARMTAGQRRADDSFAIIYMDLDGFKQVNDQLGHGTGDQLLRDVGAHVRRCTRGSSDLVARLGGDEFAMLIDRVTTDKEAQLVAERIIEGLPSRAGPPGQEVPVGMSVGVVIADVRHQTPEALLNDADRALYAAKRGGKGRFALHTVESGIKVSY